MLRAMKEGLARRLNEAIGGQGRFYKESLIAMQGSNAMVEHEAR